jgi:hypothetical protein
MKKIFIIILLLFCTAVIAQAQLVYLPEKTSAVQNKQLVSEFIFDKITSGKLKIYTTKECKKIMTVKEFYIEALDSSIVNITDPKSGEVKGTKTVANPYKHDSLATFRINKPSKTENTLGFTKSLFSNTHELIGHKSMCFIKYEDLRKMIAEFESKNYPTGFNKQMQKYL